MDDNISQAEELAAVFKALGNDTRVLMLKLLGQRPLCVGALAAQLDISQSAVSQHLSILKRAGLVEADKRGYFVHYRLAEGGAERCRAALDEVLKQPRSQEE